MSKFKTWRGYCDGYALVVPVEHEWIAGEPHSWGVLRAAEQEGGSYWALSWDGQRLEYHANSFRADSDRDAFARLRYNEVVSAAISQHSEDLIPGRLPTWLHDWDYGHCFVRGFASLTERELQMLADEFAQRVAQAESDIDNSSSPVEVE